MIATYHNHSIWSDGKSPVLDMFTYAQQSGVDIFGLSDHLCIYPDGTSAEYALDPDKIDDYLSDVRSFGGRGIEVRVGLEFDWFEGHQPIIAPYIDRIALDYRIGAVHHVELQQFDAEEAFWTAKSAAEQDELYFKYWALVRELAESSLFDIAAHLDLPKKFGYPANPVVGSAIDEALDAIAENNLVVELNTAGFGKVCAEAYPSHEILRKCRRREIPITLSADGHVPADILFGFERGLECLEAVGFTSITRFRERERWFEPLSDALTRAGS